MTPQRNCIMKNPAYFRGGKKRRCYFEGWYFKCISKDRKQALALIPGMAVAPDGGKHAFVQVINAVSGRTCYFHFPYECFQSPADRFAVSICGNEFGAAGLSVAIDQPEQGSIQGSLRFSECRPYPTSRLHPGIMGPFSFIPNMECNHVVIHLTHRLSGQLILDGEPLDFDDGAGYIEKDFGRSFPRTYVWIQASHFSGGDASFVFSRARIPFLGSEFPGFFAYFTDFRQIAVRFASYNRSKLIAWDVDKEAEICRGRLQGPAGTLDFTAKMSGGGKLRAPVDGLMNREIMESIAARVEIQIADAKGNLLYQGESSEAGMEISL
jgi:hypothetical protein